jgi:hypothetical protein
MRQLSTFVAGAIALFALGARAQTPVPDPFADVDYNLVHTDRLNLDFGGLAQVLGLAQVVDDPYQSHDRVYLFMPKARIRFDGSYDRYSFNLQLAMGGEDLINSTSGISYGLLDLAFNLPVTSDGKTYFKVGQFLVPYGREQLTDPGFQNFADVSMVQNGFIVGRDVGLAIVTQRGLFSLVGGVFTGGGRDIPPNHYLPQKLGVPELAARIGIGTLEEDPFYLRQTDLNISSTKYKVSVSGLYTHDTLLGHSTVLNIKSVDKSLLLDSNWNPFIGGGVGKFSQGDWAMAEADVAVRSPLSNGWLIDGEAQADYAHYGNANGNIDIWGARAQGSVVHGPIQLALRYDVLVPSSQFANGAGVQITGSRPIHEVTPAATYYVAGSKLKVILDAPILINAPVFTEPKVGQYVGTQLPDQVSVVGGKTGGTVGRQTVPQARLMFQGQF